MATQTMGELLDWWFTDGQYSWELRVGQGGCWALVRRHTQDPMMTTHDTVAKALRWARLPDRKE